MTTGFTREAVEELSAALHEPAWMREFRLKAWEVYEQTPMPTTNDEPWRRTDLRRLKLNEIGPSLNGGSDGGHVPSYLGEQLTEDKAGGILVQVDGVTRQYEVSEQLKEQGVLFCNMETAVRDYPELAQKYFMSQAVQVENGKFAALHGAFWRGGTFLYVPKNVKAAAPLHSALWAVDGRTFSHTLVVLEQGAEAVVIDEYASESAEGQALHNGVVELIVGDGAGLVYVNLQDFGTNVWQFNHERGRVGRDARLEWVTSVMGTRLVKNFQSVELDGRGSWARMSGLFFANQRQHFDLDTQQNHNAPDTVSDLLYKGALKDRARSVWQGLIKALPNSQRIDGFQANRNLLLERTARADSIPGLEIEADDVRCTHASTVGHIDEQEVFYLMSRGIPRQTAVRMVVEGFFAPVMERIPIEGVRNRIAARILEKVG
ncbi:MAG: Fe-S cluster assembly protein SufD [Chloroflexi bacterium]|nr:Fe-S cluster assembly protein SufD [Chloroflexota bacterium]MCI0648618.1 Fe-S cluster assembly protein SufD [Chloroflexota bacterium]MCI0730468.1 Fe-S cluster assembly protein SufD [Chloroflexota bacterium]